MQEEQDKVSGSATETTAPERKRTYLFACIHNAGRSQMAAAFFRAMADSNRANAVSAGTKPAAHVHPVVVEAMREIGIDLSHVQPQLLTSELASGAEMLITMGCGEECPYVPGLRREDWPVPDPKGLGLDAVLEVRENVRRRVAALVDEEGLASPQKPQAANR